MLVVRIGKERRRSMVVIRIDYMNKGVWYWDIVGGFILIIVVIKLIVFKIDDILVKWREKIVRFIEVLVCVRLLVRGG